MDPFDKPYWSRLQVELWVCTRSKEAVRLADSTAGSIRFADLSLGPDGVDDETYDAEDPPIFHDEDELFCTAMIRCGCICSRDHGRKEIIVALSDGRLCAYSDHAIGNQNDRFFKRADVLELWPEASVADLPLTPPESADERSVPKRKGGRPAPWIKDLREYLRARLKRGDDIVSMTLKDLRVDFLSHATRNRIRNLPTARSSFDAQIRKLRPDAIAEHQKHAERDPDAHSPLAELVRVPGISRK